MADPLPPDPYEALGVAKDATAAAIKTQYRKLALKFHPDKVKDDAAKGEASDKFHKIQSAWEIIGDETRRARYDASVKLHELRKDVFSRHHGGDRRSGDADVRTAGYKMPTESARGGDFFTRGPDRYGPKPSPQPQYEERRPSYASDEYEELSRPTSRKYDEYEPRTSKRAPPREDRDRARARDTRETERSSRKDKSRRTDKDVRRDRERKQAQSYVEVQEEHDASDEYERAQRTPPDDDFLQRARNDFFQPRDYAREASGNFDDRSRKTFQQYDEAKAYMERSSRATRGRGDSDSRNPSPMDRRPSPVRMSSSKDKVERTKRAEVKSSGGIFGVRHGSGDRPKVSRTKTEKEQKSSDEDRRNSRRKEETRDAKQPSLKQSKTTTPEVRPSYTRQRSHSMQDDQHVEEPPIPAFKRAETMPQSPTAAPPPRETRRRDNSRLHPDSASYPTPEPTPEAEPVKFRYGKDQTYADDGAFIPTPDGYVDANTENYRTQEHVPLSRETGRQTTRESRDRAPRYTHSPEPMKDNGERQSRRTSSARHTTSQKPSMPPRTTSTQYIVEPEGNSYVRPAPSRENSRREQMPTISRENSARDKLFGEVRNSGVRSSSPRAEYSYPPPQDNVQYSRRYKDADVKVQSGYSRRQDEKPSYTRTGSGLYKAQTAVYA